VYYGRAEIPWDADPGKYELKGSCGEGTLVVLPRGHVDGGDGGATGADREMTAGGAAMLGAAALGGIVLMRRRRADELV
jgi:LPXTG-motif cell wall-anchored protein